MCQMSVVINRGSQKGQDDQELVAENASLLEVEDDGVKISTLFEEPFKITGARVERIDFLAGRVFLTT